MERGEIKEAASTAVQGMMDKSKENSFELNKRKEKDN